MKFVIISSTRSGSTMFDSAFNNCKDISSFGECLNVKQFRSSFLNPKDPIIKYLRNWHHKHSLHTWYKMNTSNPEENIRHLLSEDLISNWFDWLYSRDKNVGWKLLWNTMYGFNIKNNAGNLQDVIYGKNIKVIYLSRDPYYRIKSIRNKWPGKYSKLTYQELVEETENEQEDLKRWFPDRLDIKFEELTDGKHTDAFPTEVTEKIFDYLELDVQQLKPITRKVL